MVSSNLTGQFWDGHLNYYTDSSSIPTDIYTRHCAKEMFVGLSDGAWCDTTHVVVGSDEGISTP